MHFKIIMYTLFLCLAGSDYFVQDSGLITFPPSSSPINTICRMVSVIMDDVIENAENLFLTLSSEDRAVNLPEMTTTAIVQILDNTSMFHYS